mmetsp:Transcript_15940/g.39443  ORF Transcript_15940/g.39443 Transcript_15940/m.39443 type:complete len:290 (-) Transcript_15940:204-1073(-)
MFSFCRQTQLPLHQRHQTPLLCLQLLFHSATAVLRDAAPLIPLFLSVQLLARYQGERKAVREPAELLLPQQTVHAVVDEKVRVQTAFPLQRHERVRRGRAEPALQPQLLRPQRLPVVEPRRRPQFSPEERKRVVDLQQGVALLRQNFLRGTNAALYEQPRGVVGRASASRGSRSLPRHFLVVPLVEVWHELERRRDQRVDRHRDQLRGELGVSFAFRLLVVPAAAELLHHHAVADQGGNEHKVRRGVVQRFVDAVDRLDDLVVRNRAVRHRLHERGGAGQNLYVAVPPV